MERAYLRGGKLRMKQAQPHGLVFRSLDRYILSVDELGLLKEDSLIESFALRVFLGFLNRLLEILNGELADFLEA